MILSVIIPTCDRPAALTECLRRLVPGAQTLDPRSYEVIVTDDGTRWPARALATQFPFVRWVDGPHRGPAANRNAGARAAEGEWLVFTDDDCLPEASWLQGYALDRSPSGPLAFEGRVVSDPGPLTYWDEAPVNENGGCFWSCNVAVRADLFRAVGGFDENYPTAAMEDMDLKRKIEVCGHAIEFRRNAVINHPARRVTWAQRIKRARFFASHVYFQRKWHGRGLAGCGANILLVATKHWLVLPLRMRQRGSWAAIGVYGLALPLLVGGLIPWYRRAGSLLLHAAGAERARRP